MDSVRLTRRAFVRNLGFGTVVLGAGVILAGCGRKEAAVPPAEDGAARREIEMTDKLRFVPERLSVDVGDTVVWRNVGTVPHTVTTDPAKAAAKEHGQIPPGADVWDSGFINGGQTFERTFDVPGEYRYFCIPHELSGMLGTVVVE